MSLAMAVFMPQALRLTETLLKVEGVCGKKSPK